MRRNKKLLCFKQLPIRLLLLLILTISTHVAAISNTSIKNARAVSAYQYQEIVLSKGQRASWGLGEEVAAVNQTAFYINCTVLPKSNASVRFSPKHLDFNPTPEMFVLAPGESAAENYTWLGAYSGDETADFDFNLEVIIGTNATVRFEYAFLRRLTVTTPSFGWLTGLILVGVVVLIKKMPFRKKK
ncbi:MAG: hypothetical protein GF308_20430 [Candidatus Heimdallarchaeota archaeon]|nr:hypothetical protein [Candidatus Heimdallarchaeota archaeon]